MLDPEDVHNELIVQADRIDYVEKRITEAEKRKGSGLRVMVVTDDEHAKSVAHKLADSRDGEVLFFSSDEMQAVNDSTRVFVLRLG